ncbi:hypothetical protein ABFA07_014501 [Porites harrisoni]
MDTKEIAAAQWMDLDEYIASPLVNDSNRFIAESYKNSFQNNDSVLKIEAKQIQVGKATATFFSLNQNNLQSTL